ncbi:MAG: AMP-binding protein [Myxococcales bacterium]|nr:AMP-binding protein [Myxococcales bacterium]
MTLSVLARAGVLDEALVDEAGSLSYAELAARVRARLGELRAAGLAEGSRVAIVGEATRARVIDVLAALELGAAIVMIHPRWTPAERAAALERTRPALLVDADGSLATRGEAAPPEASRGTLAILHTSGTSGAPKAAVLSRRAFVASAEASATRLPLAPGDRWLLVMPIAHVGGLSIVIRSLLAGSSIALAAPFEASRAMDAIAAWRPAYVSLVPTMLDRLLDLGLERGTLRAILLGGAACPARVLDRALSRGLPIHTTYGLTEACSQVTTARAPVRGQADGAGEPLPSVEVRLGPAGEIRVRGPNLFDGYLGLPSPFDDEGFFETGDLGRFDEAGRLHILARRRDLVVTGGENVYPAEVEAALERIPGVRAACVFGVDDDTWGQRVAAALVLEPGAPSPRAIVATLREALAPFKLPRKVAVVDALATNAVGKLDRDATARLATPRLEDVG